MDQALSGFRVVDFSQYIAGPYASMLLAEQGADVIKVERPQGDPYRNQAGFKVFNRSKKGIQLDLKTDEGQKIAQALTQKADVVIESFRPGVADRLGIGYDTIRKINPRTIYCSISGFGQTGPYRDIPGWEPIVAACSSAYVYQGGGVEYRPLYLVLPLPSYYAAFMAAFSMATALLAREITGKGQFVDISLFRAIMGPQSSYISDFEGKIQVKRADHPDKHQGTMPLYKLYQGSDGKWFFLAPGNPTFFTKFALAMGHDEWLIDPLFEGAPFLILPPRNLQLIPMFEKIFATKTRDEWIDFLRSEDIPCAPAASVEEFLSDPQVIANEMVANIEDPETGITRQMGIPVRLEGEPGQIKGPSPGLGEHTLSVLSTILDYSSDQITELQRKGIC